MCIFPCASGSRTKQGVPSSELQSFFHCPALLSFHLLIQVQFPSRHKKNRPNPDSDCSEVPCVVGPIVLHACVYPACFVEGSCLTVISRCRIIKKGRQWLFFSFLSSCMCVYMCVCISNVCGPTYVWMCMPMCNQVWRPEASVLLSHSPFYVLLQSLSPNWLGASLTLGSLSPPFEFWDYRQDSVLTWLLCG